MRLFGSEPTWRLLRPRILLPVLEDVGEADGDVDGRQRGQGTALRKERRGLVHCPLHLFSQPNYLYLSSEQAECKADLG